MQGVYIYICIYVHIHTHIKVHLHVHVYIYICMYRYMIYANTYASSLSQLFLLKQTHTKPLCCYLFIYVYIYTYIMYIVYVYTCTYACMYEACMYACCIHVYTYTKIDMYTHIRLLGFLTRLAALLLGAVTAAYLREMANTCASDDGVLILDFGGLVFIMGYFGVYSLLF